MLAAFALPSLLTRFMDRSVMLTGALIGTMAMAVSAVLSATIPLSLTLLTFLWACVGFGYSATLTPSGRLLTRSAIPEDRPALFAAQFTLSHACWLVLYPLAGWLMTAYGATSALTWMTVVSVMGLIFAFLLWPSESGEAAAHLRADDP